MIKRTVVYLIACLFSFSVLAVAAQPEPQVMRDRPTQVPLIQTEKPAPAQPMVQPAQPMMKEQPAAPEQTAPEKAKVKKTKKATKAKKPAKKSTKAKKQPQEGTMSQ